MGIINHFCFVPLAARILKYKNLRRAFTHIRDNGSPFPGIDGDTPKQWMKKNLVHGKCVELQADLINGDYKPQPVIEKYVRREGSKARRIAVLTLTDKIVSRAAYQVLSQVFDTRFHHANFGYRPHRNRGNAALYCQQIIRHGHKFWVQADISNCFGTMKRARLNSLLGKMCKCEGVKGLLQKFVALEKRPLGIVQGGSLSPLFSNVYLDSVDQKLCSSGLLFAHYGDDFVIGCSDLDSAKSAMVVLQQEVGRIGLKLSKEKSRIVRLNDDTSLNFCGFQIEHERIGITPQAVSRMQIKAKRLVDEYKKSGVREQLLTMHQSYFDDWFSVYREREKSKNRILDTSDTVIKDEGLVVPKYLKYLQDWARNHEVVYRNQVKQAFEPILQYARQSGCLPADS